MKDLSAKCGGADNGVHDFPPHCTLLYNFAAPIDVPSSHPPSDDCDLEERREEERASFAMDMLRKTLEMFNATSTTDYDAPSKKRLDGRGERGGGVEGVEWGCIEIDAVGITPLTDSVQSSPTLPPSPQNTIHHADTITTKLELIPKSFYFFPYPKEADDGRGFGCVICMILLQNTDPLLRMHRAAAAVFPSDERHGHDKSHGHNSVTSKEDSDNDAGANGDLEGCKVEGEKFIPHMALVYAPEKYRQWLELETERMNVSKRHHLKPMEARYISVWSTEGQIKDWRIIARIQL